MGKKCVCVCVHEAHKQVDTINEILMLNRVRPYSIICLSFELGTDFDVVFFSSVVIVVCLVCRRDDDEI